MENTKLNGQSKNILEENINKLKELFPEILTEDKIDFDKLKLLLSDEIDDSPERYDFTWNGKVKTIAEAQKPSKGTLRPVKEESKDWDTTKNLYIEGDNLEVLKLLQKSYYGKVKMIYIDPPYNTGKDFVYKDNYRDNLKNYLKISNQVFNLVDGEIAKVSTNTENNGKFHTNWLNMIYPRLKLAKNLLAEEGIIFISIDDYEQHNLKKICDEIFGIENFVNNRCFIWHIPAGTNKGLITRAHEYVLAYAKNINKLKNFRRLSSSVAISEERCTNAPTNQNPTTKIIFKKGMRFEGDDAIFSGILGDKEPIEIMGEMKFLNGKLSEDTSLKSSWRNKDQIISYMDNNVAYDEKGQEIFEIFFSKNGKPKYRKNLSYFSPKSVQQFKSENFEKELKSELKFENPKPVSMLNFFIALVSNSNDLILDFFSGSATTAHAIMKLNSEDEKNRNYIMVQLPEKTVEDSEAHKAGYKNICEIGKDRIRRAGEKIKSESNNKDLDIGFKVFKLDSSNLNKWDPDYNNLEQTLIDTTNNLVPERTELDLVYEIMLKYGIDLSLPVEEFELNNKKIYSIGFGSLLVCLDDDITKEIAIPLIELKNKLSPETSRVVFKDNGFMSDSDKTNIKETLKSNNINEFITI